MKLEGFFCIFILILFILFILNTISFYVIPWSYLIKKKKKKKRQCICKWHFKYRKVELNSSWRQKKHINPQYSYKFWKAVDVVLKIILEKKTLRYLIAGSILLNPRKIGIAA